MVEAHPLFNLNPALWFSQFKTGSSEKHKEEDKVVAL